MHRVFHLVIENYCITHHDKISVFLFDRTTGWKTLPNMSHKRRAMMCGLVTNSMGNQKVVIAGGMDG